MEEIPQRDLPYSFMRGARMIGEDTNRGYLMGWWGGHMIRAFDLVGKEVAVWTLMTSGEESASDDEVGASMKEHIESGEYTQLIDWS